MSVVRSLFDVHTHTHTYTHTHTCTHTYTSVRAAHAHVDAGTYVYFDYEAGWCQRIKKEFTFEYIYLEDEIAIH